MGKMEFFRVGEWEKRRGIVHGFGRRGEAGEKAFQKDWEGHALKEKGELFPLVALRQVHGDRVIVFGGKSRQPEEGDALITRLPGFALGVFTADCLPVLLFDPVERAVGVVHAGWRGTAKAISRKAVEKMGEAFGCKRENVLAAMGPCIGSCCLEVDGPVQEVFSTTGLPWDRIACARGEGKWTLDLHQANSWLMQEAGVKKENIQRVNFCTSCRCEVFYSYRAGGKTPERQLNFIALSGRGKNIS